MEPNNSNVSIPAPLTLRPASSSPPSVAGFRFAVLRAAPPLHRLPPPASLRAGLQRACILPCALPLSGPRAALVIAPGALLSPALFIARFRRNDALATPPASSRCSFVALSLSASATASPTQAGHVSIASSCPIPSASSSPAHAAPVRITLRSFP